jgi:hypothetical protein
MQVRLYEVMDALANDDFPLRRAGKLLNALQERSILLRQAVS